MTLAAVCLVLTVSVVEVGALRCYVCNSKYNGTGCVSKPPSDEFLINCPPKRFEKELDIQGTPLVCRTMYITAGTEEPTIDRRCGYKKQHKECLNTATFQIKSTTCQCESDGCNSPASGPVTSFLVVVFALLGVAICRQA